MLYKCDACGGELPRMPGKYTVECPYCLTMQTLPDLVDERRKAMYQRADRRMSDGDFDRAYGLYEDLVYEFPQEAEAYWQMLLCVFGVAYVKGGTDGKLTPVFHRIVFERVTEHEHYLNALKYASEDAAAVYREKAAVLEQLRQQVIRVYEREKKNAYTVFISSDSRDEQLAKELYDALNARGIKAFLSHVIPKEIPSESYEPYVYAALQNAEFMFVVGREPSCFTSYQVKNEWSRFLRLNRKDAVRKMVVCTDGVSRADMPKEFEALSVQDMSEYGAADDLARRVQNLLRNKAEEEKQAAATVDSLLRRIPEFLAAKEWEKAAEYCERVLDSDPENGMAYVYRLLAKFNVGTIEDLSHTSVPLEEYGEYRNALRFNDSITIKKLEEANQVIHRRYEETRQNAERQQRKKAADEQRQKQGRAGIRIISIVAGIVAAAALLCGLLSVTVYRKETKIYREAMAYEKSEEYGKALDCYKKIEDFPLTSFRLESCRKDCYDKGISLMEDGEYDEATVYFGPLRNIKWKDAEEKYAECLEMSKQKHLDAVRKNIANGEYEKAYHWLTINAKAYPEAQEILDTDPHMLELAEQKAAEAAQQEASEEEEENQD